MSEPTVFADERQAIETVFAQAWGVTCPVEYQNVTFNPPADGSAWVRLTIRSGSAWPASLGDPTRWHERRAGVLILQLFVPEGSGTVAARTLADRFANLFRLRTLPLANDGSVRFACPRYDAGGADYDPSVSVDFVLDSFSPVVSAAP